MHLTPKMTPESPMTAAEGNPVLAASMSGRYPRNVHSSENPMSVASGTTIASTFAACLSPTRPDGRDKSGFTKMHTVDHGPNLGQQNSMLLYVERHMLSSLVKSVDGRLFYTLLGMPGIPNQGKYMQQALHRFEEAQIRLAIAHQAQIMVASHQRDYFFARFC